ncbi:enoyl-CoA hydratase/isomerase family protein [Polaromonas sp. C04]|uniref:enoyl-CoA hydratase/isomerase family protein n=1 Tax=Polaromonas sp. C04 TaxID=1945857 RepID=UPI000986ECDC|nr:enoyl-CoA hydratase/isomerase family protein [Polaromonas sp. C04]OOG51200.1 hypothetical protein B0E49_16425 [Polaromonas sp. C04]
MSCVRIEKADPAIAILTMERQAKLNAYDDGLIDGLTAVCLELQDDTRVKAVIITGGLRVFSAGADVSLFDSIECEPDVNKVRRMLQKGKRMIDLWENLPMPTIAAVEGGAVGGGFTLALACDWRVFAEDAWAMIPEVKIGLNYGWGTLPRLAALAGPARAKWMSILCRRHGAAELAQWNIAEEVSAKGQALDAALDIAREISRLPMLAPQLIKRSVNAHSFALAKSSSIGDMEDMLVCMTDPEGAEMRRQAVSKIRSSASKVAHQ